MFFPNHDSALLSIRAEEIPMTEYVMHTNAQGHFDTLGSVRAFVAKRVPNRIGPAPRSDSSQFQLGVGSATLFAAFADWCAWKLPVVRVKWTMFAMSWPLWGHVASTVLRVMAGSL